MIVFMKKCRMDRINDINVITEFLCLLGHPVDILKGTGSIISSDPSFKMWHVGFPTVHFGRSKISTYPYLYRI